MSDGFGGDPLGDSGVKIATLNRGPNRELRIRWKTFKGFPFLDIREWSINNDNSQWFPAKGKGITVKPKELEALADAATKALKLLKDEAK